MRTVAHLFRSRTARRWCGLTAVALVASAAPLLLHAPPLILWNASASVPIGLYAVMPGAPLATGDLAVARLPPSVRGLAAERRYLPPDVLLIKPIAATSGAEVCRVGTSVYVNNRWIAGALTQDRRHRALPTWSGCRVLSAQQVFLANPAVPDSFDGRYFGPVERNLAEGRAFPLFTVRGASAQ